MTSYKILFEKEVTAKTPEKVREDIEGFEYTDASYDIIYTSEKLDKNGEVFIKCSTRILLELTIRLLIKLFSKEIKAVYPSHQS
jgi:hypothetical protein